jgi:hypothetical protein
MQRVDLAAEVLTLSGHGDTAFWVAAGGGDVRGYVLESQLLSAKHAQLEQSPASAHTHQKGY